ncbi:MAG TPA: septal ring lytic transglycosylase RlpA family protein [Bacteroidia bacterium]|nr:septal ring lytic transglycosylase RlpA family protein [Bacteroidia bacterium]
MRFLSAILFFIFLILFFFSCKQQRKNSYAETSGKASYYGGEFHGDTTASGDIYDQNEFSAAHLKLPFGTLVLVVNEKNKKQVVVNINDRGPYNKKRIIDLSVASAMKIGMHEAGIARVKILPLNFLKRTILADSLMKDGEVRDCFGNKKKLSPMNIRLWQTDNISHAFYLASTIVLDDGIDSVYVKAAGNGRSRRYRLIIGGIHKGNEGVNLFNKLRNEGFLYAQPSFSLAD